MDSEEIAEIANDAGVTAAGVQAHIKLGESGDYPEEVTDALRVLQVILESAESENDG